MKGCTKNEKYLIASLALFLLFSSLAYAFIFESPTHAPLGRMEYGYGVEMNFTAIKEKFEENGIEVSYSSDNELHFSIPEMSVNGTKYCPTEGYITKYEYSTAFQPKYVVEMWLNPGRYPQSSYSDALRYRPLLRPSIELVKELIYEATGHMPYSSRVELLAPGAWWD